MAITTGRTTIRAGNIKFRLASSAETSASSAGDRMYIKFQQIQQSSYRLFQMLGPATEKARVPTVDNISKLGLGW